MMCMMTQPTAMPYTDCLSKGTIQENKQHLLQFDSIVSILVETQGLLHASDSFFLHTIFPLLFSFCFLKSLVCKKQLGWHFRKQQVCWD
jgi:hypothetical protein